MSDRDYLTACMLVLLSRQPAHGWDVCDRLTAFGLSVSQSDRGAYYRVLRKLNKEGLLDSAWAPSTQGPRRRVYTVTDSGSARLLELLEVVSERRDALTNLLVAACAIPAGSA